MHVQADIMMYSSCLNSTSHGGGDDDDDDNNENAKETQYTNKRCNKKVG